MTTYTRTCPRCNGTGKYDRGTCFACLGAKHVKTATKPTAKWEVSAVYKDGTRRVVCTAGGSEQKAITQGAAKIEMGAEFWQAETIQAKKLPA